MMKQISQKIYRLLFNLAVTAAVISVNITCNRRYYQDGIDAALDGLRKYKDE